MNIEDKFTIERLQDLRLRTAYIYDQRIFMKIFLLILCLLPIHLSAEDKTPTLGSFSLSDKKKTIDIYENTFSNADDFLIVQDEDHIYIVDNKTGKRIGKFTAYVLDEYISIESDKDGNAKVMYTTATDSLVGENYYVPQALLHELVYKDGLYLPEEFFDIKNTVIAFSSDGEGKIEKDADTKITQVAKDFLALKEEYPNARLTLLARSSVGSEEYRYSVALTWYAKSVKHKLLQRGVDEDSVSMVAYDDEITMDFTTPLPKDRVTFTLELGLEKRDMKREAAGNGEE